MTHEVSATMTDNPPPVDPPPTPAPPSRERRDRNDAPIVFGVILVVLGSWFFADQTLGFDLPRFSWREIWPILLIGHGAWIALGSMRRR